MYYYIYVVKVTFKKDYQPMRRTRTVRAKSEMQATSLVHETIRKDYPDAEISIVSDEVKKTS